MKKYFNIMIKSKRIDKFIHNHKNIFLLLLSVIILGGLGVALTTITDLGVNTPRLDAPTINGTSLNVTNFIQGRNLTLTGTSISATSASASLSSLITTGSANVNSLSVTNDAVVNNNLNISNTIYQIGATDTFLTLDGNNGLESSYQGTQVYRYNGDDGFVITPRTRINNNLTLNNKLIFIDSSYLSCDSDTEKLEINEFGILTCGVNPSSSGDGTGGWINDSINTNTTKNVRVLGGANITTNWIFGKMPITNITGTDHNACTTGNFVNNVTFIDGNIITTCDAPSGSGDITNVQGDGSYVYNGSTSGDVFLAFNETRLNRTMSSLGVAIGFNSTFNDTYKNLLGTNCPDGQFVNGTLNNGTIRCSTPSASSETDPIFSSNLTNGVSGNWNPLTDIIQALGTASKRWLNLFVFNIYANQVNATNVNTTEIFISGNRVSIWLYNQTTPANTYTDTRVNGVNTTGNIQSLLNSTGIYSTFNSTYATFAYNQTTAGDSRFVNLDGDSMTGNLTFSSSGVTSIYQNNTKICLNSVSCTSYIEHNGTATILR